MLDGKNQGCLQLGFGDCNIFNTVYPSLGSVALQFAVGRIHCLAINVHHLDKSIPKQSQACCLGMDRYIQNRLRALLVYRISLDSN